MGHPVASRGASTDQDKLRQRGNKESESESKLPCTYA